ncbi:MAG: M6 family metalloprotease domain-containing protein [Muribaculaceae bacterium]|nr:M6 family metalloprotease domain-containing protein [Muribaculaceae bacterium]
MNLNFSNIYKAAAIPAVALFAINSAAMPAMPDKTFISDGLGGMKEVVVVGDEFNHVILSSDMKTCYQRDAGGILKEAGEFQQEAFNNRRKAKSRVTRIKGAPAFPTFGKQRALAVLVEFPKTDLHPEGRMFSSEDPVALFRNLLNADGYSHDGASGSVREYFLDSSNSAFDLTFDVFGPVMLKHDLTYYLDNKGDEEISTWEMVVEACEAIDGDVDFSEYDRDHDGIIDNVYIFYAGPGAATGGDPSDCIWQHASDVELLSGKQYLFDGLRLNHYACSNEYRDVRDAATGVTTRLTEGIGTVCHEFSHVLGLPDLYDVYYYGNPSPGLWDVMDTGCHLNQSRTPAAYSALDRMLLGWLEPETIGNAPLTLSLPAISANKAYMIPTNDEHEFFLLENRQNAGWDAVLPGHGMIVWRINYQQDYWDKNQVNTGRGASHAIVIPADGRNGEPTYDGDPFPGSGNVRDLSDNGYPNMLTSKGNPVNAPLSSITEAGGVITFDICKAITSIDKVTGLTVSDLTPWSFHAQWNPLPLSPGYEVTVTDKNGNPVGIYDGLSVAMTSLTVENLQADTEYTISVKGVAGKISGEPSDPVNVTTPVMSFIFTSPESLNVDYIDDTSCRISWTPLQEATGYSWTLYTSTSGEDRFASTDFKGGIDDMPAGWQTNALSTISINGFYGSEAPALSLTTDFGRLQSPALDRPIKAIEFWYRERNASGKSSIGVEILTDGVWKEADRVQLPADAREGIIYHLETPLTDEDARAFRLIYHRVDKGSLAVDDVKITCEGELILMPIEGFKDIHTGSDLPSVEIEGLTPATDYIFRIRGVNVTGELSFLSHPLELTTKEESGVPEILNQEIENSLLFDLQGYPVDPRKAGKGVYILKTSYGVKKIIL